MRAQLNGSPESVAALNGPRLSVVDGGEPGYHPPGTEALWNLDGIEYIDLLNGFGPIRLDHAPPFVTEAVASQLIRTSM